MAHYDFTPDNMLGKYGEGIISEFLKNDDIEYARKAPNARIFYNFPDDFSDNLQYNLQLISAPAAWNLVSSPNEIVIAIVDDAININHKDLRNNIWVNQGEMAGLGTTLYQTIDVDNNNEITSGEIYNYLTANGNDFNGDGVINLTDALVAASPFTNNIDDGKIMSIAIAKVLSSCIENVKRIITKDKQPNNNQCI